MGVPVVMIVLPLFGIVANLGILNHVMSNAVLLIFLYIGINVPYTTIFLMTFFGNLSRAFEEAAAIDGAGRLQRVLHVDLPCIAPTIIITLILNAGNILSVGFEKAYLMQNPANYMVSEIIATYVYKTGIEQAQFSFPLR